MNTDTNIVPSWKVLENNRTKGDFERQGCFLKVADGTSKKDFAIFNTPNFKNDADFAALALSKFAKVCEALEDSKKVIEEIYWLLHDNKETIDLPPTFNCSSDVLGRLFLAMNEAKLLLNNIK